MGWKIYDRDGHLAITLGWERNWNEPQDYRLSYVGKAKTANWGDVVGKAVSFNGNIGQVVNGYSRQIINTDDTKNWQQVVDTRPVKKPRRGKRQGMPYDWEWHNGKWQRFWL